MKYPNAGRMSGVPQQGVDSAENDFRQDEPLKATAFQR
ncbi:hypothetical protein WCP94_000725 (plasmid) [Bilophila wadsworthia]